MTFSRNLEGGEERSCAYLGKSVLGRRNSKYKGPRWECAKYVRNSKEVSGLGRGVGDEVREVTAVEGPIGLWLVF